ncbi:MAG: S41 family peptidase [Firmicutes bacterium]|nr:S41 family peptidase [Bacillota bacterium]
MIKIKKSRFILTLVGVAALTFLLTGAVFFGVMEVGNMALVSKDDYQKAAKMVDKYEKLYAIQKTIDDQFLWETDSEAQMDAICKEAVDVLDDKYSYYMNAEEYKEWADKVTGTFYGIGVAFTQDDDGTYVVNRVMADSPAEIGGLKAGDLLLKVDGKAYEDSNKMAAAIRGEEGSSVEITYKRDGAEKTVSLVRGEVKEISVYASDINKDYGYIQIASFEEETAKQFETELEAMEQKGVKGLVIDLRNNPGGMMDQCIQVADMLLPEAMITYTKDKNGQEETYNSDEHCTDLPFVLLINGNSASAAEIVAAAVKDNGGKLVGEKTFGKGVIQGTIDLQDGSAMSLTIMEYFSPDGNKIHKKGVAPSHKVVLTEDAKTDVQLEKALELLK